MFAGPFDFAPCQLSCRRRVSPLIARSRCRWGRGGAGGARGSRAVTGGAVPSAEREKHRPGTTELRERPAPLWDRRRCCCSKTDKCSLSCVYLRFGIPAQSSRLPVFLNHKVPAWCCESNLLRGATQLMTNGSVLCLLLTKQPRVS